MQLLVIFVSLLLLLMVMMDVFDFETVISDSDTENVSKCGYYCPETEDISDNELSQVVESFEYSQKAENDLTKYSPEVDDLSDHELTQVVENYEVSEKTLEHTAAKVCPGSRHSYQRSGCCHIQSY